MDGELSPIERVCLNTLHHLPNALDQRLQMLNALIPLMPDGSEVKDAAIEIRFHLERHIKLITTLQPELPLN